MSFNTKFSIIVPVYNAELFLDKCIASVLNQTYPAYELILVDDGSKDKSGEAIDKYARKYDFIKSYHKENMGQLHTRCYGISKASGDYYVFLDADDELELHALEVIRCKIEKYGCDLLIYSFRRFLNGVPLHEIERCDDIIFTEKREIYKTLFTDSSYNSMWRKAVKAELVKTTDYDGYYHLRHAEDLLQSIDIMKNATKMVIIPDALYRYTVNPASVTQSIKYENYTIDYLIRQRVFDFLEEEAVFTAEDYLQYKGYCIDLLSKQILMIANFDVAFAQKKKLFKEIKESTYYKKYLSKCPRRYISRSKKIVYLLFKMNCFEMILCGCFFYTRVRRCFNR